MKLLAIDAGHGGEDTGATANGYLEKEVNIVIARRVFDILREKYKNQVELVRDGDYTLDYKARTNKIKNKYKYCLSIHLNAYNGKGTGVLTIPSIFSPNGQKLAEIIADSLSKELDFKINKYYQKGRKNKSGNDYYYMHRLTGKTKTVIVEVCFLDNLSDMEKLNIEKAARAIVKGFEEFMETI
ncbi:MAG: N-acetylmuramoyl-L-alanine amidase [Firmicutes bacterium]|nr:N-acetylmuramoyl-L-alanine amidase [Bacillota bacterium]